MKRKCYQWLFLSLAWSIGSQADNREHREKWTVPACRAFLPVIPCFILPFDPLGFITLMDCVIIFY